MPHSIPPVSVTPSSEREASPALRLSYGLDMIFR